MEKKLALEMKLYSDFTAVKRLHTYFYQMEVKLFGVLVKNLGTDGMYRTNV